MGERKELPFSCAQCGRHFSQPRYIHTYIHTSPASPEQLALSLEHVDHDVLVDVDARVRVELGHVRNVTSV